MRPTFTLSEITIGCGDVLLVAGFWAPLFEAELRESLPGWLRLGPLSAGGPVLTFQPVEDPKHGKARLHLVSRSTIWRVLSHACNGSAGARSMRCTSTKRGPWSWSPTWRATSSAGCGAKTGAVPDPERVALARVPVADRSRARHERDDGEVAPDGGEGQRPSWRLGQEDPVHADGYRTAEVDRRDIGRRAPSWARRSSRSNQVRSRLKWLGEQYGDLLLLVSFAPEHAAP